MTVKARLEPFRAMVAIDSAFILLDAKDTLAELGLKDITGATSAAIALKALRRERYDVVILGLDSSSCGVDALLDELERLHVPTLVIANGLPDDVCSRLPGTGTVNVPFDSASIALAILHVVQRASGSLAGIDLEEQSL